jgi:hypothetical protein
MQVLPRLDRGTAEGLNRQVEDTDYVRLFGASILRLSGGAVGVIGVNVVAMVSFPNSGSPIVSIDIPRPPSWVRGEVHYAYSYTMTGTTGNVQVIERIATGGEGDIVGGASVTATSFTIPAVASANARTTRDPGVGHQVTAADDHLSFTLLRDSADGKDTSTDTLRVLWVRFTYYPSRG